MEMSRAHTSAAAPDHLPIQGSPATATSLLLRAVQCVTAVMSLVAMLSAPDFYTVPSFSFLVAAAAVQSVWSFGLAILDIDTMLISKTSSRNHWIFQVVKFGDAITGAGMFCAASAASGVLLFLRYDSMSCATEHCAQFEAGVTRAFMSCAALVPSIVSNWLTWCQGPTTEAPFQTDWVLLFLNSVAVVFAAPGVAVGLRIHCHRSTSACITVTAFGLSIIALIMQLTASSLAVIGQLVGLHFGAPNPMPDWPLLCVMMVSAKSFLSLWTLGTACASIGILYLFLISNSLVRSTNVRAAIYCALSLTTGALATISSCVAVARCLRRRRGQQ